MIPPDGWLANLERLPFWEEHLTALIRRSRHRAFEWGVFDCVAFPADACIALTGFDPLRRFRGYRTIAGAMTALQDFAGTVSLSVDCELDRLGVPNIDIRAARDGDIGGWMGPRSMVMGVVVSRFVAVPQPVGLAFIPRDEAWQRAYKIG